jgi:helix-turn-helix protein
VACGVVHEQPLSVETEARLSGMPAPLTLRLEALGESVVVSYGGRALAVYERGDQGMRNLAIVSLTRAGVPGVEVAALFGVRPEHVSRLRRQAAEGGARALLPPRGRPSKLDARARARAHELSDRGVAGSDIARTLGVSEATISRLLARRAAGEAPRLPVSEPGVAGEAADVSDTGQRSAPDVTVADIADSAEMIGGGDRAGCGG